MESKQSLQNLSISFTDLNKQLEVDLFICKSQLNNLPLQVLSNIKQSGAPDTIYKEFKKALDYKKDIFEKHFQLLKAKLKFDPFELDYKKNEKEIISILSNKDNFTQEEKDELKRNEELIKEKCNDKDLLETDEILRYNYYSKIKTSLEIEFEKTNIDNKAPFGIRNQIKTKYKARVVLWRLLRQTIRQRESKVNREFLNKFMDIITKNTLFNEEQKGEEWISRYKADIKDLKGFLKDQLLLKKPLIFNAAKIILDQELDDSEAWKESLSIPEVLKDSELDVDQEMYDYFSRLKAYQEKITFRDGPVNFETLVNYEIKNKFLNDQMEITKLKLDNNTFKKRFKNRLKEQGKEAAYQSGNELAGFLGMHAALLIKGDVSFNDIKDNWKEVTSELINIAGPLFDTIPFAGPLIKGLALGFLHENKESDVKKISDHIDKKIKELKNHIDLLTEKIESDFDKLNKKIDFKADTSKLAKSLETVKNLMINSVVKNQIIKDLADSSNAVKSYINIEFQTTLEEILIHTFGIGLEGFLICKEVPNENTKSFVDGGITSDSYAGRLKNLLWKYPQTFTYFDFYSAIEELKMRLVLCFKAMFSIRKLALYQLANYCAEQFEGSKTDNKFKKYNDYYSALENAFKFDQKYSNETSQCNIRLNTQLNNIMSLLIGVKHSTVITGLNKENHYFEIIKDENVKLRLVLKSELSVRHHNYSIVNSAPVILINSEVGGKGKYRSHFRLMSIDNIGVLTSRTVSETGWLIYFTNKLTTKFGVAGDYVSDFGNFNPDRSVFLCPRKEGGKYSIYIKKGDALQVFKFEGVAKTIAVNEPAENDFGFKIKIINDQLDNLSLDELKQLVDFKNTKSTLNFNTGTTLQIGVKYYDIKNKSFYLTFDISGELKLNFSYIDKSNKQKEEVKVKVEVINPNVKKQDGYEVSAEFQLDGNLVIYEYKAGNIEDRKAIWSSGMSNMFHTKIKLETEEKGKDSYTSTLSIGRLSPKESIVQEWKKDWKKTS